MKLELITRKPDSAAHPTPILFVHGAWHAAWCWDEYFMPYFARRGYLSFAMSYRGHGGSDGRDSLLRNLSRDYVEDLSQVTQDIEQQTGALPIVVSHSLGGYVTQKLLERRQLPAAVLLASIPTTGALPFFGRFMLRHPAAFFKAALTLDGYHFIGTPALTREAFFSADMPDDRVKAYLARMNHESYLAGFEACVNLPRPGKVRTPLLVLGAADDQVFTQAEV